MCGRVRSIQVANSDFLCLGSRVFFFTLEPRVSLTYEPLCAEFNQVVIFVRDKKRCHSLNRILVESKFPSIELHSDMDAEDRSAPPPPTPLQGYLAHKKLSSPQGPPWALGIGLR